MNELTNTSNQYLMLPGKSLIKIPIKYTDLITLLIKSVRNNTVNKHCFGGSVCLICTVCNSYENSKMLAMCHVSC